MNQTPHSCPQVIMDFQLQRSGPKRLSITTNPRAFPSEPLKSKARRSYTARKKMQVLSYWITPSIPSEWDPTELRCPILQEVLAHFGNIPVSCISEWRRIEGDLARSAAGDRKRLPELDLRLCSQWPKLETCLYDKFLKKRAMGEIVRSGWFRIRRKELRLACYPEQLMLDGDFKFSQGWFNKFLFRHHICIRFTTNRTQKIPPDYLNLIINFFRFNRRVSQMQEKEKNSDNRSNAKESSFEVERDIGRFTLSRIANMDQTPAPVEYLSGRTYAEKGSKTVWAKAEKSKWDKRQATIQLTVLGDGTMLKPWVLFKGKGQLPEAELDRYDTRVTVKFNDEVYANEEIILEWIQQQLSSIIHGDNPYDGQTSTAIGLPIGTYLESHQAPGLITLDAASFHKTQAVLTALRAANITPSTIPGGCTSLIQVLDVSVNRSLKNYLKKAMDDELHRLVELEAEEILAKLDHGE